MTHGEEQFESARANKEAAVKVEEWAQIALKLPSQRLRRGRFVTFSSSSLKGVTSKGHALKRMEIKQLTSPRKVQQSASKDTPKFGFVNYCQNTN